ncbi:hypothetical protein, partial [Streptomyces sp. NPDC060002]|uniref:hypothetical protein n=1 Tax=Streptomyces sp. NPDC060002 TaxID=3347033 RepID=UPI0036BB3D52
TTSTSPDSRQAPTAASLIPNTSKIIYGTSLSISTGLGHSAELLPDRISYSTMNGAERRRYVQFVYEKRSDPSFSWAAGIRLDQTKILSKLEMYGPNPSATDKLWSYDFGYGSGATGRVRLERSAPASTKAASLI